MPRMLLEMEHIHSLNDLMIPAFYAYSSPCYIIFGHGMHQFNKLARWYLLSGKKPHLLI